MAQNDNYIPYSPLKVTTLVGTHAVRGFGDDGMVDAGFDNDMGDVFVGVQGDARHVDSADRSGSVIIQLQTNSPSNAVFSALFAANEPVPITVTDKTSLADLFFAGACKITGYPRMVKKKDNTVNEWTFKFTVGTILHSGSVI